MALTFSVILPFYNARQTIARTVNSILNQRFRDFELLVVDDGSTDGSGQILEQFAAQDKRIRVLHKENGGANSARNLALQYVQGEYVVFCEIGCRTLQTISWIMMSLCKGGHMSRRQNDCRNIMKKCLRLQPRRLT